MSDILSVTEKPTITGTDDSSPVGTAGFGRGVVRLPAAATSTEWTIKGAVESGGTYTTINASNGSAIAAITHANSKNVLLPDEVFHYHSIVFDGNGDESTNVRQFVVHLTN